MSGRACSGGGGRSERAASPAEAFSLSTWSGSVSLSTSATDIYTDEAATLTASTSSTIDGSGFYITIFNQTTGDLVTYCVSGSQCIVDVRRYRNGFDTYVAYVSDYSSTLPAVNVQATSGTVDVALIPFQVGLATDVSVIKTNETATLTATANQPVDGTAFYIQIFNATTGNLVSYCVSGEFCQVGVNRYANGSDDYVAYVAPYSSTVGGITDSQANSGIVTISLASFQVSLQTSASVIRTDEAATLTATVNQPIEGSAFYILIYNATTDSLVTYCVSGSTCVVDVRRYANGGDNYVAHVAPYSSTLTGVTDSQAISNTVTVSLVPYEVSLHTTASVITTEQHATLTATVNQPIDGSAFYILIYNETTDSLVTYCVSGSVCQLDVNQLTAGTTVYRAYVAPYSSTAPTEYQARSSTVSVTLQRFALQLSTHSVAGTPPQVELTADTNQNVDGTPYYILIFDAGDPNTLINYCVSGKTCSTTYSPDPNQSHQYIAYIAPYSSTPPPPGYVAVSNSGGDPLSGGPTAAFETAGGSNPSESCPQRCAADPVNTATGEFFLNETDLQVPGRGVPLSFTRSYTVSRSAEAGDLGYGWRHNYSMQLRPDPSTSSLALADRIEVVQENGSQVVFTRDANGNYTAPSRVRASLALQPDGSFKFVRRDTETFSFDSAGRLTSLNDLNGYQTTLTYDTSGKLSTVTDPANRSLTFTYDSSERISSVTDPESRVVSFSYDAAGNLTKATNPAQADVEYGYNAYSWMTALTDERNKTTTNVFDGMGRVTLQTDPLGRETAFSYTTGGTTTITYPGNKVTTHAYLNGMLMTETKGVGTSAQTATTYTYDASTLGVASVTNANNHVWTYTYDSRGNRTTAEDPLTSQTSWTYNARNQVLTTTNAEGVTTTNTYDSNGNLLTTSTPITPTGPNATTTVTYGDPARPGDVTALTDPEGKTATYTWTANGYLASSTDPKGRTSTFAYNAIGWMTSSISSRGNQTGANPADFTTTFAHDAMGRQTSVTDPLGRVQTATYDAAGNQLTSKSTSGETTTYLYDAAGQAAKVTAPDLSTINRTYTPTGLLATEVDGNNNTTSYAYDGADRIASVTDPLNRTTSYGYDAAGRRTLVTDPASRTSTISYDAAGRALGVDYSDPAAADVTFGYDNASRRTSMTDATGTTTTSYDGLGRVTATTTGNGKAVGYTYDRASRLTALTYPGTNRQVSYTYDGAGQMASATDWLTGQTTFTYDAGGALAGVTRPNGVSTAIARNRTGQPDSIDHASGATVIASFDYAYQTGSGLLGSTESTGVPSAGTESYAYTALQQIQQVTGGTGAGNFGFDAAQNLTQRADGATLAYDNARQLTSITPTTGSTTTYTHNVHGQRTQASISTSTTGYAYHQAGTLATYTPATGAATTYTYDGTGLRQSKTTGTSTRQMTWTVDALPLLLDDGEFAYVYGAGGLPLHQIDAAGNVSYLHTDQLGSIRAITDANANVTGTATYSPYGEATTTGNTSALSYAGQYTDAESGLQYLRARYYEPATGQFITRDPLEALTGDPYGYADGNPIVNTDPLGLFSIPGLDGDYGFEFNPMDGVNAMVNIGRGATGGLTDRLANAIECGASDTVDQNAGQKGIGMAAASMVPVGIWSRPYFRYVNPSNAGNAATWLTRRPWWHFGRYGKAPYGDDMAAAKDALQLPNMPTSVQRVDVNPWNVAGPRPVSGNPQWGRGGGTEYHVGGFPG